ncbi:hypothetical protein V12G01_14134 [Vibrio alginolyticus 12G01]|nr:hypothetical protein V12G01_14134 [Vibrio alginolyticus 12G01]
MYEHLKRRKAAIKATFLCMVPVGGLEPPRPKATDFESVVYTNFTTPASLGYCPLMVGIIRKLLTCASRNTLNNYRLLIISPQSVTKLYS